MLFGISTNNGLSGAAENIGRLLNRRNYYFVPFKQDNPITKPRSIVCDFKFIAKTLEYALEGEQIGPILLWMWFFCKKGFYFLDTYDKI